MSMSMDAASALPNAQPLLDSAGRQGHRLEDTAQDDAHTVADYFSRQQEFYDILCGIWLMYSVFSLFTAAILPNLLATAGLPVVGSVLGLLVAHLAGWTDWREPLCAFCCAALYSGVAWCDGPPSLAKEREEEEAAAEADEADEENPAKREAAKHARREARRARRKAKLRRYIAGDWAYVPTYTYCIFSGNALALVGNLTMHVLLFGHVPSFPHEKAALIVGLYLLGLAMGFLLEHEAVPFAACVQGAYLVAACLDWCGYRLGYERVVVFWPTSFLLYDTSISDMRSPWSLAIGVAFGALLLGGYVFQRFVLRNPTREKILKEQRLLQQSESEGEEMLLLGADLDESLMDPTQRMQVQNMRQKLLEQDQLQDSEKESLRRLRSQMKNLMRKKGLNPLVEDYRKNRGGGGRGASRPRGYGSFFCCGKGGGGS